MAAAVRSPVRGLSTEELETIRDGLAAGRRPKVVFTAAAGQIAGQIGQVVQLTDPDLSEEWVVVRFGKDELPFSPADLAIPSRSQAARRAAPAAPAPELKVVREVPVPSPRQEVTVPDSPKSTVDKAVAAAAPVAGAKAPAPDATPLPDDARPARKAVKAAKVKAPAALTVTLSYSDGEWTVGAQQGSKALAKPALIKPSDALKMVSMLGVPGVHDAVEHILTAERTEAEHQAQRLRAELAEIEARLAELQTAA